MFNIDEIITATKAKVLKKTLIGDRFSISTDTRTIKSGELYLPLKGEKFDGEDFIQNALTNGANGYFVTREFILEGAEFIFQVPNALRAYLDLAKFYKNKINPKTIVITGSSGKTTTKEMMYYVMKEQFRTHKTEILY